QLLASICSPPPLCRALFFPSHAAHRPLPSFPTRRSSDLGEHVARVALLERLAPQLHRGVRPRRVRPRGHQDRERLKQPRIAHNRSEEHTSELQSRENLVCRLLLEKKKSSTNDDLTASGPT